MCRVVVWAKPDGNVADKRLLSEKYRRGMVVDILGDGQFAGREIEAGAWWRIIELPGVSRALMSDLLGSDPGFADPLAYGGETYPRKRVRRLDLDGIEAGKQLAASDTITLTRTAARDAVRDVEATRNPAVIGSDPRVIG